MQGRGLKQNKVMLSNTALMVQIVWTPDSSFNLHHKLISTLYELYLIAHASWFMQTVQ